MQILQYNLIYLLHHSAVDKVGSVPPINLKSALYAIVPLPPLCVKKILPVCPVLHPVGLANVCAAVTVVLKFFVHYQNLMTLKLHH